MDIQRYCVGKRLSDMVVHNKVIYLAGQVADDTSKDITGQTEEVLAAIDKLLHEAGSTWRTHVFSDAVPADMKDFAAMNAVWEKWVVAGHTPARATIEAKLANPAYKVEIMAIAAL